MADGNQRTQGEKDRDEIYIKLLSGIFKSLEKISSSLDSITNSCNCKNCKKSK